MRAFLALVFFSICFSCSTELEQDFRSAALVDYLENNPSQVGDLILKNLDSFTIYEKFDISNLFKKNLGCEMDSYKEGNKTVVFMICDGKDLVFVGEIEDFK